LIISSAKTPILIFAAQARLLVAIDNHANQQVTQAKIAGNLATIHAAFVDTNHLTAAFMLRFWR
jgi:hypothetical protein